MEFPLDELSILLFLESVNDVHVVGVSGMGGIGKTTLVRALYERIYDKFDFHCFIDDVSKLYQDYNILGVQKQLLSQCLNEKNLEINNVSEGTYLVWSRLRNAKTLIILDNVDQVEQLKMFTGNRENLLRECLGGGSRIIIISRDKHILRRHGVDDVYQVQPLNQRDAGQLLYQNAFKSNYVMSGYEEYTNIILSYLHGHPLAIEVLGSSLFGRSVSYWKSALTRLRENKSKDIMDVLRISFDQLDDNEKEIFLDMACFFNITEVQFLKEVLEFRGFNPEYGLQVLIDKALVRFSGIRVVMHDLLVDMGKCIVREKSPKEPRKWSRLWDYKDLHKVMSNNMAVENLEAIVVQKVTSEFHEATIKADALSKLSNLQLLILQGVNFCGNLNHLSNELGYLAWDNYPFYCLPPSFQPEKLVELFLVGSNIKELWNDTKPLHNLRCLDISRSENLMKMPNVCKAINLEKMNLQGCTKLRQIHPSIGFLTKLTVLNLENCASLTMLPRFGEAINLEYLNLKGCTKLRQIDPSIGFLTKLTVLNLENCTSLTMLPRFGEAINLEYLNLKGCTKLKQIDPSIGLLKRLTSLNLKDCKNLVSLTDSILGLKNLEYLSISGCSKLYNIMLLDESRDDLLKNICEGEALAISQSAFSLVKKWPLNLFHTRAHKDISTLLLSSLFGLPCMRELDLSFCNLLRIPDAIGNLHCLERLNVSGNNFATLPSLKDLSKLYYLNMQHCRQLKYLCELPSRTELPSPPSGSKTYVSEAGLYVFNCPELVESEYCISMGFSWMIQIIQALYQYNHFKSEYGTWPPFISCIIPGSEIPKWFHNQHEGMDNLITIDSFSLRNSFDSVACCVVFSACSRSERVLRMRPPNLVSRDCFAATIPVDLEEDLVTDKLDHMWLFYIVGIPSEYSKFEIDIKDRQGFAVQVKKYGYRWDSYLTTWNNGNSSENSWFCRVIQRSNNYCISSLTSYFSVKIEVIVE